MEIYQRRQLNLAMILTFGVCLIVFNIYGDTKNIHDVTLYFVPDIGLCMGNIYMSFYLDTDKPKIRDFFLFSHIITIIIQMGYYINIMSALFYTFLLMDKTLIMSPIFDSTFFNSLWRQYPDIMKFKVAATLHAVTFKLYFDDLRKTHASSTWKKMVPTEKTKTT